MDFRQDFTAGGGLPRPFYMTSPGYFGATRESALLRDMEYLRATCPCEVRRNQRRIAEILDKMDYEGSMIYDEYPDRYSLMRLADSVTAILRREDMQRDQADAALPDDGTEPRGDDYWDWMRDLVHVLLCNEIYARRHSVRHLGHSPSGSIYLG